MIEQNYIMNLWFVQKYLRLYDFLLLPPVPPEDNVQVEVPPPEKGPPGQPVPNKGESLAGPDAGLDD